VVDNQALLWPSGAVRAGVRPRVRLSPIKKMSTKSTPPPDLRTSDYDDMLAELDKAISELTDKIENGRIRDPERDKVRVKQYRALGYLIRTKQQVLEDVTLQELEAEIERLKADGEV
jgi:hypothetical protein